MPTIIAAEDGLEPALFDYERLKNNGYVRSRSQLRHLIKTAGFPAPIKGSAAAQSSALYHGPSVRAWLQTRATASNFLPKQPVPQGLQVKPAPAPKPKPATRSAKPKAPAKAPKSRSSAPTRKSA